MRRRRSLLQALVLAGACPRLARAGDDAPVRRGRVLRFARDHGAHLDAAIEWWYATGDLRADDGQRFGFQITFFRSRTGLGENLDSRFAPRHLLFAHAALGDVKAKAHDHAQRLARWSGDESSVLARASTRDTDVRLGGWFLQRRDVDGRSVYDTVFGVAQDVRLELQLQATQPVLLQGDAGFSRKGPQETQASHYLSEPQLRATGRLRRAGHSLQLQGRAWLDHEWSEQLLHPDAVGWDWIGMNLDDGGALTAFRLRRADGSSLWAGGSLRPAGGALQVFEAAAVSFTPGRMWSSPGSGARYPLTWQIDTPAGRFEVRALFDAQELDSRAGTGTIYWEGLSELFDARGQRIGSGFLEMTGYAGRLRVGG